MSGESTVPRRNDIFLVLLATVLRLSGEVAGGAESAVLKLESPRPRQVIQRTGVAPGAGFADVVVRGDLPNGAERATWEYRVVAVAEPSGRGREWTRLDATIRDKKFEATARVLAGGWYRLDVRCRVSDDAIAGGAVEPIGVGELFVVAGQSYATNCNDERLNVADPLGRVVAFDAVKQSWGVANDPQPAPDGSDGGSIWPPLGDALAKELRVPIGFANVAVGATSSMQWMPDGNLHPRLLTVGQTLGRFRAVLWQEAARLRVELEKLVGADAPAASPLDRLSPDRRAWYEEMFSLIYDCSANRAAAKSLVDRMMSKIA